MHAGHVLLFFDVCFSLPDRFWFLFVLFLDCVTVVNFFLILFLVVCQFSVFFLFLDLIPRENKNLGGYPREMQKKRRLLFCMFFNVFVRN